jgi:hypothetical protein
MDCEMQDLLSSFTSFNVNKYEYSGSLKIKNIELVMFKNINHNEYSNIKYLYQYKINYYHKNKKQELISFYAMCDLQEFYIEDLMNRFSVLYYIIRILYDNQCMNHNIYEEIIEFIYTDLFIDENEYFTLITYFYNNTISFGDKVKNYIMNNKQPKTFDDFKMFLYHFTVEEFINKDKFGELFNLEKNIYNDFFNIEYIF